MIDSKLSRLDNGSIPQGDGYLFNISLKYSQTKKVKREEDGTMFRQYEAEATFTSAMPSLAYFGKTSLEIANWVPLFCIDNFQSQSYIHTNYQIVRNNNGTQSLKFKYQCMGL
jgi:hypothetical protein